MATNAGGTIALRWGSMRDLFLGLEAVLPDGRIVSDLNTLRKRNIEIDHKHLLIGASGKTGIITAAILKLVQKPAAHATALVALSRRVYEAALLYGGTISAEHEIGRRTAGLARELGELGRWPDNLLS